MYTSDNSKIYPRNPNVVPCQPVSITCLSSTTPLWKFNNKDLNELHYIGGTILTGNEIRIFNTTHAHQGLYKCEGRTSYGDHFFAYTRVMFIDGNKLC